MTRLDVLRALHRSLGTRGLRRRLIHELRRRLGAFRRAPSRARPAERPGPRVGYAPHSAFAGLAPDLLQAAAAQGDWVVRGLYTPFGRDWVRLPRGPDGWRTHPHTGFAFPDGPWWRVPMLPAGSDIKDVWEPGRFGWVWDLVRAWAATGNAGCAVAFHAHLAEWLASNPPFRGPQWACGQERSIASLALLTAEEAFTDVTPPAEADRLRTVLAWSAERIDDAIGYGLSQRDNHGISEAAGLVRLGVRFAGAHPRAQRWRERGRRWLVEQVADQFADDGWYAQHSFTYMRLALQQALTAELALRAAGESLPAPTLARLAAGLDLLTEVIDGPSGVVPNHGASDGARVLPWSSAPYRDFRPLLTLGAVVLGRTLPADVPPDPETVAWLGQPPAVGRARPDGVRHGSAGGWVAARIGSAAVFLRAGRLRHRPGHLDQLHLDVRFGGREVVVDPGTFAYNEPPPWNNGLAGARVHNAPLVDGAEPGRRGPRFLWLDWPEGEVVRAELRDGHAVIVAESPRRARRSVVVGPDGVDVADEILAPGAARAETRWLLAPGVPADGVVQAPGARVVEAEEGDPTGWVSFDYGRRTRSRTVVCAWTAAGGPHITRILPPPARTG